MYRYQSIYKYIVHFSNIIQWFMVHTAHAAAAFRQWSIWAGPWGRGIVPIQVRSNNSICIYIYIHIYTRIYNSFIFCSYILYRYMTGISINYILHLYFSLNIPIYIIPAKSIQQLYTYIFWSIFINIFIDYSSIVWL